MTASQDTCSDPVQAFIACYCWTERSRNRLVYVLYGAADGEATVCLFRWSTNHPEGTCVL